LKKIIKKICRVIILTGKFIILAGVAGLCVMIAFFLIPIIYEKPGVKK